MTLFILSSFLIAVGALALLHGGLAPDPVEIVAGFVLMVLGVFAVQQRIST